MHATQLKEFWKWFVANQIDFKRIIEGEHELIDSIILQLKKFSCGLAVEFERNNGVDIMTISADGVIENFDIVQKIINEAPEIETWEFVAFRQPVEKVLRKSIEATVDGVNINTGQLQFLPIIDNDFLYMQIFSEHITDENRNKVGYACLLLLDNIIGEYASVMKAKGYEFYNLDEAADFLDELRPLIEMDEFLNDFYQRN